MQHEPRLQVIDSYLEFVLNDAPVLMWWELIKDDVFVIWSLA